MATVKPIILKNGQYEQLQSTDTIAKADVGLSNVDNTSDASKPVSTAQGISIGTKVAKQTLTDNAIVRADSTAGEVQNSGITIDDSNNIVLPTIVYAEAKGMIYKGATRFIHSYIPGYDTGGGVMAAAGFGGNVFIGLNAGNTTMTATNISAGGGNIGIGSSALSGITGVGGGYQNTGIGINAGILISTGTNNFAMGPNSLTKVTTTGDNVAVGSTAGQYFTGSGNTFIGTQSGRGTNGTSTGSYNMTLGFQSGLALTSSTYNILIGSTAGNTITSGSRNIIIGIGWNGSSASALNPSSATVSDELNIGGAFFGKLGTTKSFGIGLTNATSITARFHLPAGTATASSSSLKIDNGVKLTAAEEGANEFADNFYDTKKNAIRYARTGGTLFDYYADIGNDNNTSEKDLNKPSILVNTLDVNGSKLIAEYSGICVSTVTASTHQIKCKFGTTTIFDSGALTYSANASYNLKVYIVRVSRTVVRCVATLITNNTGNNYQTTYTEVTGLDLQVNAYYLYCTATNAGAGFAANNIVEKMVNIRYSAPA